MLKGFIVKQVEEMSDSESEDNEVEETRKPRTTTNLIERALGKAGKTETMKAEQA